MLDKNRPRLYMALYPRNARPDNPVNYHTGLIFVPKNPDPNQIEAVQYHVTNVIRNGQTIWEFQPRDVQSRTANLVSVALLGKVKKDIRESDLRRKLQRVPITQGDKNWRCRHWVWAAIQALVADGVIEAVDGQALWNAQVAFTDTQTYDTRKAVPTIDNKGKQIASEIGPF